MPEKTPRNLTCSCAVDITANESGTGGLFAQFFNVLFHLKGPPHNMVTPYHVSTSSTTGSEHFTDKYQHSKRVVLRRDK